MKYLKKGQDCPKIPKIKEIAIPYCGIVFAEMKHVIEINKVEHLTLYV